MTEKGKAYSVLTMNTVAFTVCFAVWMMNGVLITFLVENALYDWSKVQIGWLIGIPVLTGAVTRLPVGVLTDKYGGRFVYCAVMIISAIAMFLMSYADSTFQFILGGLGFGLAGASFAVGIAYTSVWFPKKQQGTALGIFGAGNAGAALTSMGAPFLLSYLTHNGNNLDNWRLLPRIYAVSLLLMTVIFFFFTYSKKTSHGEGKTLAERLAPLKNIRVWRFGLYYFFVFGGFVALAQWLIPYYVNVYTMSIATAGLMASIFTLPSGVIRALGGLMSDKMGARRVMYWVFGLSLVCCALLMIPRMDIYTPGSGVMARSRGIVTKVSASAINVGTITYSLQTKKEFLSPADTSDLKILPEKEFWQEPVVAVGDVVKKKQLLAKGVTHIFFQANVWILTGLIFIVGIMMGIGKAAVYKHIPDYFPEEVGVVGGIVGVLGGLGGFFCPIIFGYLLKGTGIWTTCWMFFTLLILVCLLWMHKTIQKMMREEVPDLMKQVEGRKS
jgi:MFS transporter, NNP family, nitrate/nitrite transporter